MDMKKDRFTSLQSNGPIFPEVYRSQKLKLAGEVLPVLAEEMIWKAARFLDSDYEAEAFQPSNNMWACLKPELTPAQQKLNWPVDFMSLLKKCKAFQEQIKADKKLLTKDQKLADKAKKDQLKEKYGFALLDGESVPLSGYMIEASNWILTRGKDPRKFSWKYSVTEEEVTLNIVKGKAPASWKGKVKADSTGIWVMKYKVRCGRKEMKSYKELNKQIAFAPSVSVRQANTSGKFTKVESILKNWSKIQNEIKKGCLKKDEEALVIYLIQQTGIRIGNERDEKTQADTRGMSTLKGDNISFEAPNKVTFDFLGKDSVRDFRTIEIDVDIWKILNSKTRDADELFFTATDVNGYLRKIQPGATVKNLRSVVCNEKLVTELKKKTVTKKSTEAEKIRAIFEANLEIAKTLNHQRNVGKTQKEGEAKIAERVQRAKDRVKSSKEKVKEQLEKLIMKEDKYRKLYTGTPKLLKKKLAEIKEAKAKLETRIEKAKLSVEKTVFALDKKKLTADISLGTSMANYADPQVISSYCKSIDLPMSKIFTPGQLKNFTFAENVDENYWRNYP